MQLTRALALTVGHFIKHIADSEPPTHHRGGKAAVCALLKASVVGVQAWRGTASVVDEERGHGWRGAPTWGGALTWGDARASASKKRSMRLGTAAQGAMDGCAGNGGSRRRRVVLWRNEGGVGAG